jgi:hypothetical protein
VNRLALVVVLAASAGGSAAAVHLARGARAEPAELAAHRARWADERRALDAQLEDLQARLLVSQARVRFWTEMRSRHESVTAVACTTQGRHAEAIAHFGEQQRVKTAALTKKNRLAVATVPREEAVR